MTRNKLEVLTLEVDRIRIDGHVARVHYTGFVRSSMAYSDQYYPRCLYLLSRSLG